jgi:hypothetical protein
MATYANVSNQIAALQELITGEALMKDMIYKRNPFFSLVPKDESPDGFSGKYMPVPVVYGAGQGRSATFLKAQTNQTAALDVSFFVYRVQNYQVVTITNELLEATKNSASAFIDQASFQLDKGMQNLTNDIALGLSSDGTGARGQISAISTGAITLTNIADVVNFEVGMTLVSYSVSGTTATQSTSTALGYVIGVNRSTGVVTVSATAGGAAGTPTNWSTSFPYLSVEGDIVFGSGNLAIGQGKAAKICGLQAWVPSTAPSAAESFWGVDRSVDPTRLGGLRYDGSAQAIEEALTDAMALFGREGAAPDMAFVPFASYAALLKGIGSKVQYVEVDHKEAKVSFAGVTIIGDYGPMTIIPDRNMPAQKAYCLSMDTWKLRTLNKAPHVLTYGSEGLQGIRVNNDDSLEIRLGMYGNLICSNPGANGVVSLSQ